MADLFLDLFIFIAYEYVLLYSLLSEPTKEKNIYLFIFQTRTAGLLSVFFPYLWIMIHFNSRVKAASVYWDLHGGDSGGINCCVC